MNILVLGARGTLGKPLVESLKKAGHNVYQADLHHTEFDNFYRIDISNFREVLQCFEYFKKLGVVFDYVYNMAAEFGRWNGELFYDRLWKSNAIGNKNILEIQKLGLFDKYIFFSSSEVYGNLKKDFLSEDDMLNNSVIQHNDYAISKWVNEQQIINHEILTKLPVMRIRLFNAYGPGECYSPFRSVVCLFCYNALNKKPYVVYKNYHRVFMYIDDLIPSLVSCIKNFKPNSVVNIGGNEYRSVEDLSNIVLNYLGIDDSIVTYMPEDKHNTVNKRPNISYAQQILGHNPQISLEYGVPLTIEWMKKYYNIGI